MAALASGALLVPAALHAEPVARTAPVAGSIIRTRSGETAVLVPSPTVRRAEVLQQLKAGDVLRTNGTGALALVFADQTQVRLGPNSVMVVREVRAGQPSSLQLQRGRAWGRSPSGKTRLSVETPSATAAIRGTEWAIAADEDATTLEVFDGAIEFANDAGSLTVSGGQAATARPGQAPTRVVLVNRVGREQMLYYLSRDEGLAMLAHNPRLAEDYRAWFDAAAVAPQVDFPPLDQTDPDSWAGRAFLLAWQGQLDEALRSADNGLARHPASSALYEVKTRISLLQGNGALAEQTVATWLEQRPDDGAAYAMRAEVAFAYLGEPYGALADARRAVDLDDARPASFATLAEIRLERGATREALRAIDRAIALTPDDAGLHARRAAILLERNRVRAARREVERAMQLDPSLSIVRAALARYQVQTGHSDRALDELLAASAGNPAYAPPLIDLAEVYYRAGEDAVAQQQLDAADRLDPANPQTPLARTAIALDSYAADDAIVAAREAMRRYRARGGVYSSLSENRTTGSYVSEAFRFLGLEGWGRYYGDRVFDSFVPSAYFDQALNPTPSPFILAPRDYFSDRVFRPFDTQSGEDLDSVSSFIQGLLLDPLSVTGSEKTPQFSNERFLEAHAGARVFAVDNRHRPALFGGVDGILHTPIPFGFSLDLELAQERFSNLNPGESSKVDPVSATGYFGAEPTPDDRVVLFGSLRQRPARTTYGTYDDVLETPAVTSERSNERVLQGFGFWSHSFGARNVLTLGGGKADRRDVSDTRRELPGTFEPVTLTHGRIDEGFELLSGSYARTIGRVDLKAGAELIRGDFGYAQQENAVFPDGYVLYLSDTSSPPRESRQDRYYLDARFWPRGAFQFQAHAALVKTSDIRLIDLGDAATTLDLRFGAAWEPAEGHWLRVALGRNTPRQVPFTLAPSTTLGLRENLLPAFYELLTPTELPGQVDSVIGRWDAEWTSHVFTAVEYQHQRFGKFLIASPDGQFAINGDTARIHRVSATADIWATGNVGIALAGAWTDGHQAEPGDDGMTMLPFLPEITARASLVWTNQRRISARLAANYVGPVWGGFANRLPGYTIVNAGLQWEPFDKAVEVRLDLFNLLDAEFRTTDYAQGPGRAVSGSVMVRF
jgi:tetratricopeptide (TPR) repeat protein